MTECLSAAMGVESSWVLLLPDTFVLSSLFNTSDGCIEWPQWKDRPKGFVYTAELGTAVYLSTRK